MVRPVGLSRIMRWSGSDAMVELPVLQGLPKDLCSALKICAKHHDIPSQRVRALREIRVIERNSQAFQRRSQVRKKLRMRKIAQHSCWILFERASLGGTQGHPAIRTNGIPFAEPRIA